MKKEICAAIALALHEHAGNNIHDKETGIITIKGKEGSNWNSHILTMTKYPR